MTGKQRFWILLAVCVAFSTSCSTAARQSDLGISPSVFNAPPPSDALTLWTRGEQFLKNGNPASAIAPFEEVAQRYSRNAIAAKALVKLGDIALQMGQAPQSIKYLDYLLATYPVWEGIPLAKVDRLRALRSKGDRSAVLKEGAQMWETSSQFPEIQFPLSLLLAYTCQDSGDTAPAFDWLSTASTKVQTDDQRGELSRAGLEISKGLNESSIRKIMAKNPSEFAQVLLEYRWAELEMEKGNKADARNRLTNLLGRTVGYPIVAMEIAKAVGETPVEGSSTPIHLERIGCLLPLTGQYEKYGREVMRGLALAQEEWNESHPKQPVNLVFKDSQDQPETAVKAMESFAGNDGVLAVVGLLGKQSSEAVQTAALRLGLPLLTMTQREETAPQNPFVFHIFYDKEKMIGSVVRYCTDKMKFKNFAVLYPSGRYGESFQKFFEKVVKDAGANLVGSVSYQPNTTNFKDPIQKLVATSKHDNPSTEATAMPFDALFIPDESQTVAIIAPQLPYYNLVGITLLGTNSWAGTPTINEVGGVYVEKALFATPYYTESKAAGVQAFIEKFKTVNQAAPTYLEAQAYDTVKLALEVRSKLTTSTPAGTERYTFIQRLLQTQGFNGVTGTVSFTSTGEIERSYTLLEVRDGQLVPIDAH